MAGLVMFRRRWGIASDDFVYAVALSPDLSYCCYGGTNKAVVVLDGRTGAQVCRLHLPGTIWALALLPGSSSATPSRLAIGGECPTIAVYDLLKHRDVLQLPVQETTYSIAVTSDALCYSNGTAASMYGQGGTSYGWQDQPSFGIVTCGLAG